MNRFRETVLRDLYDASLLAFRSKHRDLFLPSGERRRVGSYGSNFATCFWRGYDGIPFSPDGKRPRIPTLGYACWRAGQDVAASEKERYVVISVAEAAVRLGLSVRRVQILCKQRRVPGAKLIGRMWYLPDPPVITPATRGPALTNTSG